jgi:hypothetical protein
MGSIKRQSADTGKHSFAILPAFLMIVAFASISSAAEQKIKARVPGIT